MLFALTFPLAVGPLVYLHYKHHGRFTGWPALLTVMTFLYGWALVAFTLFPLPSTNNEFCSLREDVSFWQLRPFASLDDVFLVMTDSGVVAMLTSTTFLQVFFNVVLLIPLGLLLAYRFRKSFGFTVVFGLGTSLLIELTQGTGFWGLHGCPWRLADVDDLIANTTGAAIGWLVGRAVTSVLPDPNPERVADLEAPHVIRRFSAATLDVLFLIIVGLFAQIGLNVILHFTVGPDFNELSWLETAQTSIGLVATGLVLFMITPLMRSDRATLGQVATWLAVAPVGELANASGRAALIRFSVRWLPVIVTAYFQPLLALAVVAVYETITVAARSDRRSTSAVASGTETVTRRSVESK